MKLFFCDFRETKRGRSTLDNAILLIRTFHCERARKIVWHSNKSIFSEFNTFQKRKIYGKVLLFKFKLFIFIVTGLLNVWYPNEMVLRLSRSIHSILFYLQIPLISNEQQLKLHDREFISPIMRDCNEFKSFNSNCPAKSLKLYLPISIDFSALQFNT